MADENFDRCFEMLMLHEGGYVNHPNDPGGETNWGVTKNVYERWVGRKAKEDEMKNLTQEDVKPIYRQNYWLRFKCDKLPSGIDHFVMDFCVNAGNRGAKTLQKAIGAEPDGAIGPKTLSLLERQSTEYVIEKMHEIRQEFYESLKTFETFGKGRTRRNDEAMHQAKEMAAI